MNLNFSNKTVIVTGGTRGIGAALVEGFSKAGANLLFTGTKAPCEIDLSRYKESAFIRYHQLDFSMDESIDRFLRTVDELDAIDVLVNNAAENKINHIEDISLEDWDRLNSINLRGPFLLTKAVAKVMKERKQGRIINIASIFGVVSKEKRAAYSSTKSGLIGFTKAVALDLAPFNVQVNSISPGFVDTDLTRRILGTRGIRDLTDRIPQKRLADPGEISNVVMFVASSMNTYLTGQNIVVDGGFTSV